MGSRDYSVSQRDGRTVGSWSVSGSVVLSILLWVAVSVWGWRQVGLCALGLAAVLLLVGLIDDMRERRARAERGGPAPFTARRWEREHFNGRRSWVQEVPYVESLYEAGARVLGSMRFPECSDDSRKQLVFGTLEDARRLADDFSECPQSCACPDWTLVFPPLMHK